MFIKYHEESNRQRVAELRERGVEVWSSERVFIGEDVRLERISSGCILMNAVLTGDQLSIGPGTEIGVSGTAVIHNSQIGTGVQLGAGSYTDCVLMDGVKVRGFAEIRGGTILEEQVEIGHNVGLKNSIFTAFVIAGSCINFCDVLVSGGTSRQDHSEIGSGAIHFNYSPKRDKFASLLGDVAGLLLRSSPVFVGGQTGLIAPCEIPFGAIIPAGEIVRQARDQAGKIQAGLRMLANLAILRAWYENVRLPHSTDLERQLIEGAVTQVKHNINWRNTELQRFAERRGLSFAERAQSADSCFAASHVLPLLDRYRGLRARLSHIESVRLIPQAEVSAVQAAIGDALRIGQTYQ